MGPKLTNEKARSEAIKKKMRLEFEAMNKEKEKARLTKAEVNQDVLWPEPPDTSSHQKHPQTRLRDPLWGITLS